MSIQSYWSKISENYDEISYWNKGDREMHTFYLEALLKKPGFNPSSFLELGCGTGFFTASFFKLYPEIFGVMIDGSPEMLKIAKEKLGLDSSRSIFICRLLEAIDPSTDLKRSFDVVFSALTIHHLDNEDKIKIFKLAYQTLNTKGAFILFDIFKTYYKPSDELLEYLACRYIQAQLKKRLDIDFELEELTIQNIIINDRNSKLEEGDHEMSIHDHLQALEQIGYGPITVFYQESNFFGLVAYKR